MAIASASTNSTSTTKFTTIAVFKLARQKYGSSSTVA